MPSQLDTVLEAIKGLNANNEAIEKGLQGATQPQEAGARDGAGLFNLPKGQAPAVRTGESPLTSRGFSYLKTMGLIAGKISPDTAKVETDLVCRLQKHYDENGFQKSQVNSFLVPLAADFLPTAVGQEKFAEEVRQVVKAGVFGYDPHEALHQLRRDLRGYSKALSWVDETQGGALVAPPIMGELVDLLRNNEVLTQAGCRMVAMPPNGRLVYPRQTGPGTAYWVGESTTVTDSTPTTGDLTLSAKKLGVLTKVPNELFRFSSISVEQFLREDMARVAALQMDKTLLEGPGSTLSPKGLINYSGITKYTSVDPGTVTNGYHFDPLDPANLIGQVESTNAVFKAFIMRPLLWSTLYNRRADAVVAGDKQGPFLFNIVRDVSVDVNATRQRPGNLHGYPVYKSTNISNARSKGSSNNLTYVLGGDFSDYIIAMSGALEFMVSTQGDTPFQTDQTWFRSIMFVDGAPRHEASFVLADQLYENS